MYEVHRQLEIPSFHLITELTPRECLRLRVNIVIIDKEPDILHGCVPASTLGCWFVIVCAGIIEHSQNISTHTKTSCNMLNSCLTLHTKLLYRIYTWDGSDSTIDQRRSFFVGNVMNQTRSLLAINIFVCSSCDWIKFSCTRYLYYNPDGRNQLGIIQPVNTHPHSVVKITSLIIRQGQQRWMFHVYIIWAWMFSFLSLDSIIAGRCSNVSLFKCQSTKKVLPLLI